MAVSGGGRRQSRKARRAAARVERKQAATATAGDAASPRYTNPLMAAMEADTADIADNVEDGSIRMANPLHASNGERWIDGAQ